MNFSRIKMEDTVTYMIYMYMYVNKEKEVLMLQ